MGHPVRCAIYIDGCPRGTWMGHYLEELGCSWLAESPQQVIADASGAIAAYLSWLHRNGEPAVEVPAAEDIHVEVAQVQEVDGFGQSGAAVGFFAPDTQPVTDAEIATALRRLGYARRNLLETIAGLPPEALDWRPPGGKRSVCQNLEHVRNCHGFYLSRLLGMDGVLAALPPPWPEELFFSLTWTLEHTAAFLAAFPAELRAVTVRAHKPDENWTARKMLRRFVEHEREHVDVVSRTVQAWRAAAAVR